MSEPVVSPHVGDRDRCGNCRYSFDNEEGRFGSPLLCLRRAPGILMSANSNHAVWPHVHQHQWCGDYERESPRKPHR